MWRTLRAHARQYGLFRYFERVLPCGLGCGQVIDFAWWSLLLDLVRFDNSYQLTFGKAIRTTLLCLCHLIGHYIPVDVHVVLMSACRMSFCWTANGVQENGNDRYKLLLQVMSQRVEMAAQFVKQGTCDLESGDVDFDIPGLRELNNAARTLTERFSKLFLS